mgnify:CR=1 FL=1
MQKIISTQNMETLKKTIFQSADIPALEEKVRELIEEDLNVSIIRYDVLLLFMMFAV